MPRYVVLEFDDKDSEFADRFLNPEIGDYELVTYARIVGEAVQYYDADDLYTVPRYKVAPIGETNST